MANRLMMAARALTNRAPTGRTLPTALDRAIEKAARMLRRHAAHATGARNIPYTKLPLTTDLEFEGVPLQRMMAPTVPPTGPETCQLFDTWMWPRRSGEGDSVEDLGAADKDLLQYLGTGDFGTQTVRLLHALSTAKGARLAWDDTSVMVHHDAMAYGIINGTVYSRFCDGTKVSADHRTVLTAAPQLRSKDPDFCSLYRESRRVQRGLTGVLVALTERPGFSFKDLANLASNARTPTKAQFARWLQVIHKPHDPVAALYKQLVPKWMSATEFGRVFAPIGTRPIDPSPETRQVYINRLYIHFS